MPQRDAFKRLPSPCLLPAGTFRWPFSRLVLTCIAASLTAYYPPIFEYAYIRINVELMSTMKSPLLTSDQLEAVSDLFATLAEPSRLTLLQALHDGPLTVSQLMEVCAMKQTNVSKHLAVLHDHKLVKREREGTTIRYEIADPVVFSWCQLVCGKMKRDAKKTAALFAPEI
jgi:DNA-binding transcriptional ArsR family regulator